MDATTYVIEVEGAVPASLGAELTGFRQRRQGERTVLTGPLPDAAALYGLLARLETLGVVLVAVRPLCDPSPASAQPQRRDSAPVDDRPMTTGGAS